MNLPPVIQTFVLHFGEMGSRWGINRTVGQIYALLYLSEQPLNADQIVDALGFSRSNVAMGLKELASMNLVMLKHIPADRKDYYGTHDDIWDIVRNLVEERRRREIEPTLTMLRSVIMEKPSSEQEKHAQEKMQEMHDLIEMLTDWYEEMNKVDTERLVNLLKMGAKIYNLYQFKDKLKLIS
ncbi:GbsR/MarR family transcriptional regulator [Curvivirga aplysinae]|uniref:GbsR/MarR family transcriptional regulator n=1 Tax=Curvivirga aplysinae TaxID=2529852 RepID=UPI0012BC53A7|nr:GbsR/MarR family transcriptional regulator [Curvivirga aplysinae]MTI09408.1 GbsR/MarR family transcriptional regulator [Curvivirga aplysinae]